YYLNQRGHGYGYSPSWPDPKSHEYYQDDVPVRDAEKIKGHAVRAMYLYTGTADVAAVTGDTGYLNAVQRIWYDIVYRNMYLTGGIGSSGANEGFTVDYDLPNVDAYCETCASVGMVLWNQRMNLLTGESKYIDILERTLYNAALDGLSLSGDHFFYGNPLASTGQYQRSEWFGTACCPANIARLVASLGNYIYNQSKDGIWVNLFIGSKTITSINQSAVTIEQHTNYPWDGEVNISVSPEKKSNLSLHIRIPGWAQGHPVPGDLYYFRSSNAIPFTLTVNGKEAAYHIEKGYAVIDRGWRKGDLVQLKLPMPVQLVAANATVKEDVNRLAIQRGPLIYCVEEADNHGQAWNILLPENTVFSNSYQKEILGGVVTISASLPVINVAADGLSLNTEKKTVTAIPYYVWCNRDAGGMQVWLPMTIKDVKLNYDTKCIP
ncbi:MAG TPA: beta-L-arabinofuranosidase domain-containing protein, partial [Puia sp.]|nr:beta-L-arabinofuranosidase domain-containing protein [Puia sp.]